MPRGGSRPAQSIQMYRSKLRNCKNYLQSIALSKEKTLYLKIHPISCIYTLFYSKPKCKHILIHSINDRNKSNTGRSISNLIYSANSYFLLFCEENSSMMSRDINSGVNNFAVYRR